MVPICHGQAAWITKMKRGLMPDAIIDLLFWIAIFVGLFFGLRWMKARRNKDK
jgi:hypothetical protein